MDLNIRILDHQLSSLRGVDPENGSVFVCPQIIAQFAAKSGDWVQLSYNGNLERKARLCDIEILGLYDAIDFEPDCVYMSWLLFFNMTRKYGQLVSENNKKIRVSLTIL